MGYFLFEGKNIPSSTVPWSNIFMVHELLKVIERIWPTDIEDNFQYCNK